MGSNHEEKTYAYISYKHEDIKKIRPYLEELHRQNVDTWHDERLVSGKEWSEQLADKLEHAKCMILFMSSKALNSKNIKREINFAVNKDIPIICVYLEKVHLQGGMLLQLDIYQAIFLYDYDTIEEATRRIAEGYQEADNLESHKDFLKKYVGKNKEKKIDSCKLIIFTIILSVLGIFFQNQISPNLAAFYEVKESFYVERQVFHTIVGCLLMWGSMSISLKKWYKITPQFYLIVIILVGLLWTPFGALQDGIRRILDMGLISFAPTILLVVAHIFVLAYVFQKRTMYLLQMITALNFVIAIYVGNYLQMAIVILMITIVIAVLNNDMGVKVGFAAFCIAMAIYVGRSILKGTFYSSSLWNRINTWLNPYQDPYGLGFFSIQRLEAIKRGGPFGTENATYKELIPQMAVKEDVWVCILEEFGWLIGIGILLIYFFLLKEIYKITKESLLKKTRFGVILSLGVLTHIAFSVIHNVAGTMNIIPMFSDNGYLPFLSYGGMNIIHWFEIGLVLSIKRYCAEKHV